MNVHASASAGRVHDPPLVRRLLDALPLFADLDGHERDALSRVFAVRVLRDGEPLCREGAAGGSFFIVARGVVVVFAELPGGVRERLSEIGPNDLVGQVALVDGRSREATCLARGPCVALECTRADFDRLFEARSAFAFEVVDRVVLDLAKRLREATEQVWALHEAPDRDEHALRAAAMDIHATLTA